MVLVWVLVLFFALEVGTRIYFARPGITDRNIEKGIDALPYLFDQMDKHKGKKIAWIGSSVLQGFLNVEDGRNFTSIVENNLHKTKKYKNAKCFNLAAAGNNFGDHYCILEEALRHNPDLIVVAIHFKSFSQHTSTNVPIRRREMVTYLHDDPKFNELMKRWQIGNTEYLKMKVDNIIKKLWAFYRYKGLIASMITGTSSTPTNQIQDWYMAEFGYYSEEIQDARLATPDDHNVDYLWKLLPEKLVLRNYELSSTLDFSDSNINWRTFKDLCELGRKNNANVMFYLTPINRAIVEEKKFFNWSILNEYKHVVAQQVRGNNHMLIDMTNEVDSAYFSDTDHMNMNGHAQVARRFTDEVEKALKRGKRIAKKGHKRK